MTFFNEKKIAIEKSCTVVISYYAAHRYRFLVNEREKAISSNPDTVVSTSRILIAARDARLIVHESNPRDAR